MATPPVLSGVDGLPEWVQAFDLTFSGFGGDPVRAWLVLPRRPQGPPVGGVVHLAGYSGGRGEVIDHLGWAGLGLAVLAMDSRGQGWTSAGVTGDPHGTSGPAVPGLLTQGIESSETLYHRRLITDAVRAVATLQAHPAVDADRGGAPEPARVGTGTGRGRAGRRRSRRGDRRAVPLPFPARSPGHRQPIAYGEIRRYLGTYRDRVDQIFATLDHVDGVDPAARGTCPALFSVALMDLR